MCTDLVVLPPLEAKNVLVSCVRRADLSLIQRILDYRASMQVTGDDGKTLLQTAVCRGDASVLGCLLQANCDISTLDRCGRSALVTALRQDRSPFVLIHMLLDARCDTPSVDVDGMQPLAHAVGLQDLEIYKSLLLRKSRSQCYCHTCNRQNTLACCISQQRRRMKSCFAVY